MKAWPLSSIYPSPTSLKIQSFKTRRVKKRLHEEMLSYRPLVRRKSQALLALKSQINELWLRSRFPPCWTGPPWCAKRKTHGVARGKRQGQAEVTIHVFFFVGYADLCKGRCVFFRRRWRNELLNTPVSVIYIFTISCKQLIFFLISFTFLSARAILSYL